MAQDPLNPHDPFFPPGPRAPRSLPLTPNPRRPSGTARPSSTPAPPHAPKHDNSPTKAANDRPRPVSKRIKNLSGLSPFKGEPYAALVNRMKNPGATPSRFADVGQGIEDRNTQPANSESELFEDPVDISREVPAQFAHRSSYVGGVDPSANNSKAAVGENPYIGLVVTPVGTDGNPIDTADGANGDYDMFPFYFSDFRRTNRIIRFPATLTDLAENYDVEWNSETYYGRVQQVPIYRGTNRSITVGFKLIAVDDGTMSGIDQVNVLYQKLEAFIWLLYPSFRKEKVKSATDFEQQLNDDRNFKFAREKRIGAEGSLGQLSAAEEITITRDGKNIPGLLLRTEADPVFAADGKYFGIPGAEIVNPRTTVEGQRLITELEEIVEVASEFETEARSRIASGLETLSTSLIIHKAPLIRMRIGNMIKRAGNTGDAKGKSAAGAAARRNLGVDSLGVSLHDSNLNRDAGLGGYITNASIDYHIGTNEQKLQVLYDPAEREKKANFVSYHIDISFNFEVVHDETPYGWNPNHGEGDTSGMLFYTRWQDYKKLDKVK